MADSTTDYLTVYKRFFENFAKTVDPDDQLPVRVAGYRLWDSEIVGETVDWTLQYLSQRNCPPSLLAPITRIVIDEIQEQCATEPLACGFRSQENCYLPLKLMRAVTNKVNDVCLRFCDNGRIASLPPPTPGPRVTSCAVKNTRRCMEDRHVILEDFHAFFNIKNASPASYYAVFDGHAGTDAAIYSVSHLHQFLAESSFYPTDPENAIKDAFLRTDSLFIEKSNKENLRSGTTAVCALLRPKEKKLFVAWLGDSQAVLVRNGETMKLVNPHKPDRKDEMTRIQDMGGSVLYWGTWRVNGQLAVSRAIGDLMYKPYVTAEPDVKTIYLQGDEDFLILACDGIWDFVSAEFVVDAVYNQLIQSPGDVEAVSQRLVQLSKQQGSTDNITVIVVVLRDPAHIAAEAERRVRQRIETLDRILERQHPLAMDLSDMLPSAPGPGGDSDAAALAASEAITNPFSSAMAATAANIKASAPALFEAAPGSENAFVPPPYNNGHANGNLLDFLEHATNVLSATTNGKGGEHDDDEEDDDSGAEAGSGADALDASPPPPPPELPQPQPLLQSSNPFGDDLAEELQRQQTKEFDPEGEPARDTPTPPADEVPGVIGLVSDNVAESGEESEDEWNYYRVEPTEKSPQPTGEPEQQTKQEICSGDQPENKEEISEDNMESQLNPNAAEFIPSPTHTKPSMEEYILSKAKNEVSMDDVIVPSSSEFEKEVSSRPSDVAFENPFFNSSLSSVNSSDLEVQENENQSERDTIVNPVTVEPGVSNVQEASVVLDDSAAFSTKAEFGDESSTSFMIADSEFQTVSVSAHSELSVNLEDSVQFLPPPQDLASQQPSKEPLVIQNDVDAVEEITTFQENINDFQKEPVHISFELQKEIAPQMESQPERVKVDSVDDSPVESDMLIANDLSAVKSSDTDIFLEDTRFSDNFDYKSSESQKNEESVFDNFMSESATQQLPVCKTPDTYEKTEELIPQVDDFELLCDFSKPPPVVDKEEESQALIIESNIIESESSIDDFRKNLSIQKESLNLLNNEMSTPEYEKLERVVEASEALMDQINMTRKDGTVDAEIPEGFPDAMLVEGAILESAHPDKTELLVDACVEIEQISPDPLGVVSHTEDAQSGNDVSNGPESVYSESPKVPETISPFPFEEPVHIYESDISSLDVIREAAAHEEIFQTVTDLETTQTPPPTPAVNEVVEPLDFNRGVDDFAEVIEKLSAEPLLTSSVTDEVSNLNAEISTNTFPTVETSVQHNQEPSTDVEVVPSAELQIANEVKEVDVPESVEKIPEEAEKSSISVAAAIAGVTAAAGATAAAVLSVGNQDLQKETPTKKTASSPITKKLTTEKIKSPADKQKTASTDRFKTTTKTTTSKLTSVAKAKSPTSPVKSPVAVKASATKSASAVTTNKPTTRVSSSPKPASKPLSSTTGTLTTTSRAAKPTGTQPLSKLTAPKTSTLKPKPAVSSNVEKKPLTNGEIKTAPKRPEQLATKTTMRPAPRPATAPAAKAPKPAPKVSSTSTKSASSALNGPSRARPSSSASSRTTTKPSTDKEIKETANKQISTRTSTAPSTVRNSVLAAKPSVPSAPRKIESKPLTNGRAPITKPSTVKSTTASKIIPKRPTTATKLKSTKTSTLVEKSETVQGSKTVVTTNEVKSEIVIDNTQSAA